MEINKEEAKMILEILGNVQIPLTVKDLDAIDKIKQSPVFLLKDKITNFISQ